MKNTNILLEKPFAHRGLHCISQGIPENSIKAFELAVTKGYPIELDVHLLTDGNIIVFHDDNLKRMTGIDKDINTCNYEEIRQLKLANTEYGIPLLEEVLTIVSGKVTLLIELKSDHKIGTLEPVLMNILNKYSGQYAIESFHPFIVNWFRKNYPAMIRGQLSGDYREDKMVWIEKIVLKNMVLNFLTKPDFIAYDIRDIPNKKIEKERQKRILIAWTIRTKEDRIKAQQYCDNYIAEKILK